MSHYDDALNAINGMNQDLTQKEQELADAEAALTVCRQTVSSQADEIRDLKAEVKRLEAEVERLSALVPRPTTLYGANVGGYAATQGEASQTAFERILAGFGQINIVRWWPNNFFTWNASNPPSYYGDRAVAANLGSDIAGINTGKYDAALEAICRDAVRRTLLTAGHEPEDDAFKMGQFTIAQWQSAQMRMGSIVRKAANPLVSFGPLLMGTSYHKTRYVSAATGNRPASEWMNFDMKDIDFIGADLYQWGKSDADADLPSVQLDPYLALCAEKGKAAFIGELGTRRPNPPHDPGISPAKRAEYLSGAIEILDSTEVEVFGVCYYETDRGAADKVPWNLLAPAGKPQHSPEAIAVWKGVSTR